MSQYTVDQLILSMKLRGYLPSGTGLTTSQILVLMTEELGLYMPALLKSIREEYLVAELDIAVAAAAVPIPERACGSALRTVQWLDGAGKPFPLNRIEPERRSEYASTGSEPCAYLFQGDDIILVPAVTSGTLHLSYQQRPGRLVLPEDCGEVTAINTGTKAVTISAAPSTFTNSETYDFVSSTPNFRALALDQAATVASTVLTFATALPARLAVGDFVCLSGDTCIPQMPTELHTVLAQRTAYKIAEATGSARAPAIGAGLAQARADAITLLSPRSDGSSRPIVSRYGAGRRRW